MWTGSDLSVSSRAGYAQFGSAGLRDPGPRVPGLRDPGPGAQGGLRDPGPGTQGGPWNPGGGGVSLEATRASHS